MSDFVENKNIENVTENTIEHCNGCERCCPSDNLHCWRGRKLFGVEEEDGDRHRRDHDDRGPRDDRGPHRGWDSDERRDEQRGPWDDRGSRRGWDGDERWDEQRGPWDDRGPRRGWDSDERRDERRERRDERRGHRDDRGPRRGWGDDERRDEHRGPRDDRGPHRGWDGDERRGQRDDRGPRPPRGPRPDFHADDLEGLLHLCAHHLFHRRGVRNFGSAQSRILEILADAGGSADQKALQEGLRIQPASISELLTKLEDKGFITRSRSEEDRRRTIISLTEAGSKTAADSAAEQPGKDLFAALTDEEQSTLKELLKKLIDSWH